MSDQTFASYPYTRPDKDAYLAQLSAWTAELAEASDSANALNLFRAAEKAAASYDTMYQVAYIRNSINTKDAFYEEEINFFNDTNPIIAVAVQEFNRAVLASPFLPSLKEVYGDLYFERMAMKDRLTSPANVENQVEENRLVQEYFRIAGNCLTQFHGETLNFYGLLAKMQSTDRTLRKEALTAWSELYASVAPMLDDIYSRMIEVRCRMAETLGFKDYTEMMYLSMERFSYNRDDVAAFRESICRFVVPLVERIYEERKGKLGLDTLHYYDEPLTDPRGNADPKGSTAELLAFARQMYRELSPETGKFFDAMMDACMFDLETGDSKQQGGYCTFVPDLSLPFIFSNFNGTSADVDVLTHEAGHSFEAFTAYREGVPADILFGTSEVAEIHSMSMEFFTHPWMELFFAGSKEDADRYRYIHLQDSLTCIPYMACVDEFQHLVYADHMTDAEARYALWHRLEKKYMPWRDYDGDTFLEKGGFWLQKQHIFMCPFYYIDYAMAGTAALEFFLADRADHASAWERYMRLCRTGGRMRYFDLLKLAELHNPFEPDTLARITKELEPLALGQ